MPASFPPRHRPMGPAAAAWLPHRQLAWGLVGALALAVSGCGGSGGDCPDRYADRDGDGFGDRSVRVEDCDEKGVLNASDCDDGNPEVFPGQVEQCNDRDDDCNGLADDVDPEELTVQQPRFLDADADGYGSGNPWSGCGQPPPLYTATNGLDCDDGAPQQHPGAEERCNDRDDDCNGVADDNPVDQLAFYFDRDGDGYGASGSVAFACSSEQLDANEQGYDTNYYYQYYGLDGTWVPQGGDCSDTNQAVHPGAVESCNGVDDDCDGAIDEEPDLLRLGWYDRDGDGFGGEPVELCVVDVFVTDPDSNQAVFVSSVGNDCDDDNLDVLPGAVELCNGVDDDCDGAIDDQDVSRSTFGQDPWHLDRDGDGFGDPATAVWQCTRPTPTATTDRSDCNDDDDQVSPDGSEVCNQLDDDCDGHVDDLDDSLVGGPCL